MIKTKKGKTVIKGNILTDVEDLMSIIMALTNKHNITFINATLKSIIQAIENTQRNKKINDLINKL